MSYRTSELRLSTLGAKQYWTRNISKPFDPDSNLSNVNVELPNASRVLIKNMNLPTLEARNSIISSHGVKAGYASYLSGESTPPIPITAEFEWKDPTINSDFKKRSRNGEIIVAPYGVGKIRTICYPGNSVTSSQYGYRVYLSLQTGPTQGIRQLGNKGRFYCTLPGFENYYIGSSSELLYADAYTTNRAFQNPSSPFPDLPSFRQFLASDYVIKPYIVASVGAEANSQSFDFSTFIGELPETMRMFTSLGYGLINMVRDLRRGNLSLSKSFANERSRLGTSYSKKRKNLEELIVLHRNDPTKSKFLKKKLSHITREHSRALEKTVSDANSALADLWLGFRYGLMPLLYSLDDIADAQAASMSLFQTSRETETFGLEFPDYAGWSKSGTRSIDDKCMIKRKYGGSSNDPLSRGLSSTLSLDIPLTIWELIPLSFVVDWFINIGDVIQHNLGVDFHIDEGATYSFRDSGAVVYKKGALESHIQFEIYSRVTIQPDCYVGLNIANNLNVKRVLDSVALLWGPTKRALIKSKKG